MRYLLIVVMVSACASLPVEKKEWSDAYDSEKWRNQYETCKAKLFTKYPAEINTVEWSKCMGDFDE